MMESRPDGNTMSGYVDATLSLLFCRPAAYGILPSQNGHFGECAAEFVSIEYQHSGGLFRLPVLRKKYFVM